jgi:hypothetical protein
VGILDNTKIVLKEDCLEVVRFRYQNTQTEETVVGADSIEEYIRGRSIRNLSEKRTEHAIDEILDTPVGKMVTLGMVKEKYNGLQYEL